MVPEGMSLIFCRMTLNPDPPDVFSVALRSSLLGGKTTEMMLCSFSAVCVCGARGHMAVTHPTPEMLTLAPGHVGACQVSLP